MAIAGFQILDNSLARSYLYFGKNIVFLLTFKCQIVLIIEQPRYRWFLGWFWGEVFEGVQWEGFTEIATYLIFLRNLSTNVWQ